MNKPQLRVGVTTDRITGVSAPARRVHRAILRAFASTGRPPDRDSLTAVTGPSLDALLRELHDRDVVRLDERGGILAAYPFSGRPTTHTVAIAGGATVYAMCAIDALGMSAMLGRDTTIRSTDPHNGHQVTVTVHDGQAAWEPVTAVVVNGVTGTSADEDCCVPAVDRCCSVLNFFTDPASAHSWLAARPAVSGVVLDQGEAMQTGVDTFGRLLE
ncbi:alkylmercury lyase family protein [Phytohabitans sp. LJ34]|uniref:alkylmercury lyase family protein n=1 Tax=Phytohabitans sp. LJ34 TaxID=3452217 RepID=UPI003F8C8A6E